MGRVDTQNAQVLGEELQLLQRQLERPLVGVAFDVGVELGLGEAPADHVALQLGHVDAVGGEAAQRLVQHMVE